MNRRRFLTHAGALALLGGGAPVLARSRSKAFGIQLFSLPKMLDHDFARTIGFLAELGYREVETFGPYTFSDPGQVARWKTFTPSLGFSGSGFFGKTLSEAHMILKAHGMTVPSMHTDIDTLQRYMGPLSEAAHQLGATYVTLPSLPPERRQTLDDFKRSAELFNAIGADAAEHGVKFAYHNHGYGLKPIDDQVPLDLLLDGTNPAHVFLELDIFWTIAGGGDPIQYLSRYAGRYKMLHLKDMREIHRFAGDGGTPDQWIALFKYMTYLGDGALDLKSIIAAADKSGVSHFFVEQDNVTDPEASLGKSAQYLIKQGFR